MSLYAVVQIIIFAGPGAVSWLMYTTTTAALGSDSSSKSTSWYIGSLLESKISVCTIEFSLNKLGLPRNLKIFLPAVNSVGKLTILK